tara:strand:+ start:413 stop:544 length:132 start_codon:yes stop_codon:yes gene_type:complete
MIVLVTQFGDGLTIIKLQAKEIFPILMISLLLGKEGLEIGLFL